MSIHDTYLPFTEVELRQHFADTRMGAPGEQHTAHYRRSAERAIQHAQLFHGPDAAPPERLCSALDHQIEKDERFWIVTALMTAFHRGDRIANLSELAWRGLGPEPPIQGFTSWAEALGDGAKLRLFFEVNLPAPEKYRKWLSRHVDERTIMPSRREHARRIGRFEGTTKVDAMVVAPDTGVAIAFEAKVLSDCSTHTEYDAQRNQLARNLDVLLEPSLRLQEPLPRRLPERTCFLLVTPRLFKDDPTTRLYGSLICRYQHGGLADHLPHREGEDLSSVAGRIGWITWEDCRDLVPGSCPWLPTS